MPEVIEKVSTGRQIAEKGQPRPQVLPRKSLPGRRVLPGKGLPMRGLPRKVPRAVGGYQEGGVKGDELHRRVVTGGVKHRVGLHGGVTRKVTGGEGTLPGNKLSRYCHLSGIAMHTSIYIK